MTNQFYHNLTEYEKSALAGVYNLADAHTHQSQSERQRKIVAKLPQLWYEAERYSQKHFEDQFLTTFFTSQKQETAIKLQRSLLSYSASVNMMIVANFLMKRKFTVGLVEPCFDNLPDLLWQSNVELIPIQENQFTGDRTQLWNNSIDALFLVYPNNPTGFSPFTDAEGFEAFVEECKVQKKLLILDLCFSPFVGLSSNPGRFDLYEILERHHCSYIAIEDTGKMWPVMDAKCSIITASEDLYCDLLDIQTDVLLNVSPFILHLLTQYIRESQENEFEAVSEVLVPNYQYLCEKAPAMGLEVIPGNMLVSVAWLKIISNHRDALTMQHYLEQNGVHLLPGNHFFWSDRKKGLSRIRIALARDPDRFREGIDKMAELLVSWQN
ncbi:MAG: aminotransferase class I/II-fold pyridoxal phosphate-dependent enzyme [Bacteroidota bacterium]